MRTRDELAARLMAVRRARGWTRDQVAAVCGVSRATVWRLETGQAELGLEFLERLAAAWQWSPPTLIARLYDVGPAPLRRAG